MFNLTEFISTGKNYCDDFFAQNLEVILGSFRQINNTLSRMPEKCSPEVYYKKVRPYIFGFENVVYDGVPSCSFFSGKKEQTFRGETGAQSSIIPSVLAALGIKHKSSMLTEHLDDMRRYMPPSHRGFIKHLEESTSIREFLTKQKDLSNYIKNVYNAVVDELCKFREIHFSYAVDYIQKKCDNPSGTGGTPYVKWLNDLVQETKTHHLKVV
jgi:indoleamine 2,3-dioxygenase